MGPDNRPLDLEWLEDFLALAEHGNFSRAAEARSIAQPAFSRHIRALEDWVQVELFDRSNLPVALTTAGEHFHPLVKDVLANLEAARIKTRAAHSHAAASLRFAATNVLSLNFFPHWLANLEASLRLGSIQTMSDSLRGCEDLMQQRRVQFVLCHAHPHAPSRLDELHYPVLELGIDVLRPVCLATPEGKPRYALQTQHHFPMLAYGAESGLGRILQACFSKDKALKPHADAIKSKMDTVFTAQYAVLLKTMALEGRGIAWLPQSLIEEELRSGKLVPAADAMWDIQVAIHLYRQTATLTPTAEALWQLCVSQTAQSTTHAEKRNEERLANRSEDHSDGGPPSRPNHGRTAVLAQYRAA